MRKVQSDVKKDRALDELYRRYANRPRTFDDSPEYEKLRRREILTKASASKSYKVSSVNADKLKQYKNGVASGRRYMTGGDFADYYKSLRNYTPESNVELDTTILLQKIDRERYKTKKSSKPIKRTDIKKIMVIGSGPIVIGQGAEFDYAGTQACLALKEEGYEVILVNSNPATIMTDTNIADKVYMEPLDLEHVAKIIRFERPDGLICSIGGQTGLNLGVQLARKGILDECQVELLGTTCEAI